MNPLPCTLGRSPTLELDGIFAKLECTNPTGSIKDRIVSYILEGALAAGSLVPGMRIVEATSGNTGIALAYWGRRNGFPVTIVMPEHMTEERKALIRELGADLVLVSKEGSFAEAVAVRDRLAEDASTFCLDQFSTPRNAECHERTTGAELLVSLEGRTVDTFVAGVGTGGTLIGVGRALRKRWPRLSLVAVEPAESAVMTGGEDGPHRIFGIGDGFVPTIVQGPDGGLSPEINRVEVVSSDDAIAASHELRERFQVCVGISSGANWIAARRWAKNGRTVATVFPDGFSKYASHGLMKCALGACPVQNRCPEPIPCRKGNGTG